MLDVVHARNPTTRTAEAGGSPVVGGQPGLRKKLENSTFYN